MNMFQLDAVIAIVYQPLLNCFIRLNIAFRARYSIREAIEVGLLCLSPAGRGSAEAPALQPSLPNIFPRLPHS